MKYLLIWLFLVAIGVPITLGVCAIADAISKLYEKLKKKYGGDKNG
jgi:hypothetical protein